MDDEVARLIHAVLDLDRDAQLDIAEATLASLDGSSVIDRAWLADARQRFEAIRLSEARVLEHREVVAANTSVASKPNAS
ncbi:MAG TPA: hypothetical protein VJT67_07130 [Longimicrobiaceae bacterium]|nr:hypothetical protein [Longimicrobiaceae bacterium]